jgi:pyruvate dehydrogenase E2 component (dihydrolipoamide acetyltransferase)
MPKWGMSMSEGTLVEWLADEGTALQVGDDVAEVETEKINGIVEATAAGVLRRHLAAPGDVVPVGGLIGVIAAVSVSEGEIDEFIEEFRATFVPESEDEQDIPEPEVVEIDGRRIRYLRQGTGEEVVLLLHGFGGDLENWLFNHEVLSVGRIVYALDLPGHGGSSKDVGAGDLDFFAGVVSDFLDVQGHSSAHLVGHSLGGAVAVALCLRDRERVDSLTLIAPAGFGSEINGDFLEGFLAAKARKELKPLLESLFADSGLVTRQLVDNVLRYKRLDGVEHGLETILAAFAPGGEQLETLAPRLADEPVPLLVIWGAEDRIIPVRHADATPERGSVEIIQGAGHSPHLEAAGAVNRVVDEFLSFARWSGA